MKLKHAILHVFDFETGSASLSQQELDLSAKPARSFVQRHVRKVLHNPESRHGRFAPESMFAGELERYLQGQRDFVDLSLQIAQFLYEELRLGTEVEPLDLLLVDFEDDVDLEAAKGRVDVAGSFEVGDGADFADAVDDAMQKALDAAYDARGHRCLALILLPRKSAFMHDVRTEGGLTFNDVLRIDATLPNPTQKVDSYAVIDAESDAIDFSDKPRTIAGTEELIIPGRLLQCSSEASTREVLGTLTGIVESVAAEHGANTAMALSRAKRYVSEHAGDDDAVSPQELGQAVFADDAAMLASYEAAAASEELPEQISVKRSVATRMAKSHRIRTDTGIEVIFPSEYSSNTDFIEFTHTTDGRIAIEIKNVARIENR